MTANQIAYQAHLETVRANQAREAETNRSNLAGEVETNRHNLQDEMIRKESNAEQHRSNLAREVETNRANLANELQKRNELQETNRANVAKEGIQRDTLAETAKHNRATESLGLATLAETQTHNRNTEQIQATGVLAQYYAADQRRAGQEYAADVGFRSTVQQTSTTKSEGQQNRTNQMAIAQLQSRTQVANTVGSQVGHIGGIVIKSLLGGK